MKSAKILIMCGAVAAAFVAIACSDSGSSSDTTPATGGSDAGADQTAEAQPDVAPETQAEAAPEAGPDQTVDDVVSEPLPSEQICSEYEPGFDAANPGISFTFSFGITAMMGMEIGLAAGAFMKTGREDFCKPLKGLQIPLDTCTTQEAPAVVPQCTTKAECEAGEECKPDTNANNQPIPGTEHCTTPRSPLDVGQFTITGFKAGPKTFHYNTQQNGAYTATDSQDGQIPPDQFAFDADYTFGGTLDGDAGLGAINGTFHFPASFQWVGPALVDMPNMPGLQGLAITAGQDLALQWSGGAPDAILYINLAGGTQGAPSVHCRVTNDGTFTVPAAMIDQLKLNANAFLNIMELRLESAPVQVTGAGITHTEVTVLQTRMINLIKK